MQKLTITEAAKIMNCNPMFLRLALRNGKFPFGTAVKYKRWSYYINPHQFYEYIGRRGANEQRV